MENLRPFPLVRVLCTATLAAATCLPAAAQISNDVVKIGFLGDLSGPYSDPDGLGSVEAIRMAIAEAGGQINGKKIELLYFDHQNKPDLSASKAREWIDRDRVDALIVGANSASNIALARIGQEKKIPIFAIGGGSAALTNELCSPYTLHWAYDTVALARGIGQAMIKEGAKTWYYVQADGAFATSMASELTAAVQASGGQVVGVVKHPQNAPDLSQAMVSAAGSKAQVMALLNAGSDTVNAIKTANEFGLKDKMKMSGLFMFLTEVHGTGLPLTQGMYITEAFYWNRTPESRAWSRKFFEKMKRMPTMIQAGSYSAAHQFLKAVAAAGTDNPEKVMEKMRSTRFKDIFMDDGFLRADGRVVHDMYVMQVKTPAESKEPWDYYKVVSTLKGEDAWTTKAQSKCPLWK